jgi:hypothetical protein
MTVYEDNKVLKEMVAERKKRSTTEDFIKNSDSQLSIAAKAIYSNLGVGDCPKGWDKSEWIKIKIKPLRERKIIAGSLLLAEKERIDMFIQGLLKQIDTIDENNKV